jgi:hypothetical protein
MMNRSLRTNILNVFAHLSSSNASFAEGDFVVDDQDGSLYTSLCEQGASLPGTSLWYEIALPSPPLEFLCSCLACDMRGDTKSAIRFRKHHDEFVVFRLMKHSTYTTNGIMEHLRISLWGLPPTGEGCIGGYRSTDAERYDTRSRLIDEALHARYKTAEELRLYNRKHRISNELYLPKPCWTDQPTSESR